MPSLVRICAIALVGLALAPSMARAATTGTIEGTVTEQASGKRLAGVTVTVTSPALQGEQTEFTDESGHYIITELPPGEYLVRFYFHSEHQRRAARRLRARRQDARGQRRDPDRAGGGQDHPHPRARAPRSTSATRRCRPR